MKRDYTIWCGIFAIIWCIIFVILIINFLIDREKQIETATKECRDKWWYIEMYTRTADILCRDREWKQLYFRK